MGKDSSIAKEILSSPRVGDVMPDGTVYAGTSPNTGKPMYAMPKDAPLTYTFNSATDYAARLNAFGRGKWRVPTDAELNVLYNNRALIGGFDESGAHPLGWYWSSSQEDFDYARGQRFSDGMQHFNFETSVAALRCVR